MLHLQAGVHLQEEELAVLVGEELHRSRTRVGDGGGRQPGGGEQFFPHGRNALHQRRRRLLDDLLVPALDRALPFTDRPEGAVLVGHDLHLDVTPARKIALAEYGRIAEGRVRLAPRGSHLLVQLSQGVHYPHPATTTAGRRLD